MCTVEPVLKSYRVVFWLVRWLKLVTLVETGSSGASLGFKSVALLLKSVPVLRL